MLSVGDGHNDGAIIRRKNKSRINKSKGETRNFI